MTNREVARFLVITFALAFVTQAFAVVWGVHGPGKLMLGLTMWAPAMAAFVSSRAARQRAIAALKRSGFRSLGWALLVGWSFVGVQMIVLALSGAGHWNEKLFPRSADGTGVDGIHGLGMVLGVGHQSYLHLAVNLFLSVGLGSLVVAIIGGIGEEIGWRAVLQPEMERRFGPVRGTALVGLIWAYWHVPANLAGYNDSAHPILNTFVFFPLVVVCMAFAFAWLTKRSGSVWPAALAHGGNNTLSSGMLVIAGSWAADQVSSLVAAALVASLLGWRLTKLARRNDALPSETEATFGRVRA